MRPISLARFNALAGYARDPRTILTGEELGWYEHANERVLGILIRDRTDNDFAGIVLARDELLQYRWTNMTNFERSVRRAEALLRPALEQAALASDEEHYQSHPAGAPVDFFTPKVPKERLSPNFRTLTEQEGFSPAFGIIEPMMRWYDDVDGNFIEQFQTTGFDARMWELYLFATLVELGFAFDRSEAAPDFLAWSLRGAVAIEAATVNPTRDEKGAIVPQPPTETAEEVALFLSEYMPIKFGSTLYSKLVKEYWTKEHVRDLPFAIAIEDFSAPASTLRTRSALQVYLYGYAHDTTKDEQGELTITPRRVPTHRWGEKKIPSGFFFLPSAENVSAVIFSNSGTISKFNRMGAITGFGSNRIRLVREGLVYDHDPNAAAPKPFRLDVGSASYSETWVEGLEVYHNPQAKQPLHPALFPSAAHIRLREDGSIDAQLPEWHPISSRTFILAPSA